jgi:cell division protein FtsB
MGEKILTCEHCNCKTNQLTDNLCSYCCKQAKGYNAPDLSGVTNQALLNSQSLKEQNEKLQQELDNLKQENEKQKQENEHLKKEITVLYMKNDVDTIFELQGVIDKAKEYINDYKRSNVYDEIKLIDGTLDILEGNKE